MIIIRLIFMRFTGTKFAVKKKLRPELKDTRYLWLENLQNLNASQSHLLEEFHDCHLFLDRLPPLGLS